MLAQIISIILLISLGSFGTMMLLMIFSASRLNHENFSSSSAAEKVAYTKNGKY
ncbi:hypothetical protein [Eupransor demetentiae]|uniref:NADH dehydrogenase subunit 3 n=1 Tax=Eupransor demetentiae TaxID=3109584 RepID=A0ABM9N496_9LACO|nr:hypothetical protein R54876_GBNLAHCA_00539 [Lactobacillaceae bacterium LMG 33000]